MFGDVWDRIEKAKVLKREFGSTWEEFLSDDPYSPLVTVDHNGRGSISVKSRYESLPRVFAITLGQIVYQLRAALDACIYETAVVESGQDPPPNESRLEFPICFTDSEFQKSTRKIQPLSVKRREIVESVQPFNTPQLDAELLVYNFNDSLGMLHDWARKDRHRGLRVLGSYGVKADPKLRVPDEVIISRISVNNSGFIEDSSVIATFELEGWVPQMKIQANPDIWIDITVNEDPAPRADNDSLGNRLTTMIQATSYVVKKNDGELLWNQVIFR